jgi:arsenate reductase
MSLALVRRLLAELHGSAFLAAVVIGSGIAAQRLSPGDVGLELFENAAATGAGLFAIILMFGPISGAHFNPVVSLVDASFGSMTWRHALAYVPTQITGCILGAVAANGMFAAAAASISTKHRATSAHLLAEVVATLGLLLVIFSLARTRRSTSAPAAVGAYIRGRVFLHQLDQLREPSDQRRPHVLQQLCRHRPRIRPGLHRRAAAGRRGRDRRAPRRLPRRGPRGCRRRRAAPRKQLDRESP